MKWLLFGLLLFLVLYLFYVSATAAPRQRWKLLRRWLLVLSVIYALLMVGLVFMENALLYHPTRAETAWQLPGDLRVEDVWLASSDGTRIHAWWCPAADEHWVLLYCHGNAGNLSDRGGTIRQMQKHLRVSVLIFDYPGFGRSDGSPDEASCHASARAAYDWLIKEKQVPPERVLLFGKSLGAAMALELAMRVPHRACVMHCAFTSVPDMAQELFPILPARWLCRSHFDNLAKIHGHSGPVFLAHAEDDQVVPFDHGQRLYEAAGSRAKHFHGVKGGWHGCVEQTFFEALNRFLDPPP